MNEEKEEEKKTIVIIYSRIILDFPGPCQSPDSLFCRKLTIQMSHQRECKVANLIEICFIVFLLITILFFVIWISVQLEQAGTPYRMRKLQAIADEEEVVMDIIRAVNRYEFKVVPELPGYLRDDLIWTEETLLKPLEDRIRRRQKLLNEWKQNLKK